MQLTSPFPYAGITRIRSWGFVLRRFFLRHPQRNYFYTINYAPVHNYASKFLKNLTPSDRSKPHRNSPQKLPVSVHFCRPPLL